MEQKILSYLQKHEKEITEDILTLVRQEASTSEVEALHEVEKVCADLIKTRLGIEPTVHEAKDGHRPITVSWGKGDRTVVLVGHYDTVHLVGTFPVREEEDRIYGPGIFDMKGGIAASIWAIKALQETVSEEDIRVLLFLSGDEETGSFDAKERMCRMSERAAAAIVMEPAYGYALKTGHKGQMKLSVDIKGKASHSGTNYEMGINAIEEMAYEIISCQRLTDLERGTTVNVGVCSGGTKPNVVPDCASIIIDCRYYTMEECERVRQAIEEMPVTVKGTSRKVTVHSACFPMERNEANLRLFDLVHKIGEKYGMKLTETVTGGRSDGNYLAELRIPITDGLGMVGGGSHTKQEYILRDQIVLKTALTAATICHICTDEM